MKYNIGDIISWLFPIERPEISTLTRTYREFDGTLVYEFETYRREEDRTIVESFSEIELDNILDNKNSEAMATHYPVKQ